MENITKLCKSSITPPCIPTPPSLHEQKVQLLNTINAIFNLEPDDSNNYVSTTNAEGETESVYSGPTLDVKDSILKLTAAMVAINQAANSASNLANLKEAIKTATADFMEAN